MQEPFGLMPDGRPVHQVSLHNAGLGVVVLTLGATLHSVRLAPLPHDLTLGQGGVADYLATMRYHGKIVAPVANRLSHAQALIDGKIWRFEANEGGNVTLHSGAAGTQCKLWQIADLGPQHVALTLTLADGEGGFPGRRHLRARFALTGDATLRLDLQASTDAPTLFNAANHSYWNLDGTQTWSGHSLTIAADRYLPTTPDLLPTGEIAPVGGTPLDFAEPRQPLPGQPPLDTCFCLSDARAALREVLVLRGRHGVTMTLATTEPAIQVYDGRAAIRPGRGAYEGLAIEPQGWPDAPNHRHFPPIDLGPDAPYHQTTTWRFALP